MSNPTTSSNPLMPSSTVDSFSEVMFNGNEEVGPVPVYTLTFTNNTDHTVYPFLFATNDAEQCSTQDSKGNYACSGYAHDPANNPGCIYDPIDPYNNDYRGYIGYTGEDDHNYLGLPAGETVVIPVPLAFWDAGRIFVATDSADLTPNATVYQSNPPTNPFQYYDKNEGGVKETLRYQQAIEQPSPSTFKAVVMWYRADVALVALDDAPAQLLEFTIRDPYMLKLNSNLDKNTLGPLINYDVSYVDTIYLPVAMEATDVPDANGTKRAFGWTGAIQSEAQFQQAFEAFVSAGADNGLGLYFGTDETGTTRGYTRYNIADPTAGVKLPSGASALGDSPLLDKRSSYGQNIYLLSSGGTGGIKADVNTSPDPAGSATANVTFNSGPDGDNQRAALTEVAPGVMDVICNAPTLPCGGVLQDGTKLLKCTVNPDGGTGVVTLSQPTNPVPDYTSCTFTYARPASDYVSSAIISLWYSWAKYYMDQNPVSGQQYPGELADRVITFTNPVAANTLVPGMTVTGNGIPSDSDGSFCTITAVSPDAGQPIQSVTLSELAANASSGTYTFAPLEPLPGADNPLAQTFPLSFEGEDVATALEFSRQVYQALSALSTIPNRPHNYPLPLWVVFNTIGCNVGQIPYIGLSDNPPDDRIGTEITLRIKSILRGVPDFQAPKWPETTWYPDPSTPTGGCKFNAYNLDPFVWFVHKKLGLSGYGFSVDDDIADVGANGATNLVIAITGTNGLPNSNQWSPDNPYGG